MYLHHAVLHVHVQYTLFDSGQKQTSAVRHLHFVNIIGTGLDDILYRT